MDPLVTSSLISAGSSLLGGLMGGDDRKKNARAMTDQIKANARSAEVMPTHIRKGAETAGFNPLTVLTQGQSPGVQYPGITSQNYMGAAVADAGMIIADAVAKSGQNAQVSALEAQNAKLAEQVQSLTLRPKVGGIYAGRVSTPTTGAALGVSNASAVQNVVGGDDSNGSTVAASVRPLAETLPVDPRRKVDNSDIKTNSGFMVIDNPAVGFPIYSPTLDGDEALQWYDLPTLGLNAAGSYLYHKWSEPKKPRKPRARPNPNAPMRGRGLTPSIGWW